MIERPTGIQIHKLWNRLSMVQLVERMRAWKPASRWSIVLGVGIVAAIVMATLGPIPQPQSYHDFADAGAFLGVPNGLNVLSNLPFVVVGLWGLCIIAPSGLNSVQRWACATIFAGLVLTGIGSGYYHLAPDNQRLIWDRLPMTIAMAGFVGVLLVDRFGARAVWALPFLATAGLSSVVQWGLSEQHGHGDLRWYAFYQGMVMIFAAAVLLMFPSLKSGTREFALAAVANLAAKVFELLDFQAYQLGGVISGHTLKHLAASLGFLPLVLLLRKKQLAKGE